jgi:hypothetical protein
MDNFEKFLDEQFPAMVNNGSLHGTTVDLIKLALTKRAEKADKVILALEAVSHRNSRRQEELMCLEGRGYEDQGYSEC